MTPTCTAAAEAILLAVSLFLDTHAIAQVPRGWAISSHFTTTPVRRGEVWMFHSLVPGMAIPIQGLPAAIAGAGAASVLVHPVTGDIVVGTHTPTGQNCYLHFISLTGGAATPTAGAVSSYFLGTGGFCYTDQMAWVGDGVLVCNRRQMTAGPLAGHSLGWVRPSLGPPNTPGTVVPFPLTTPTTLVGIENALAVDAVGQVAFVATWTQITQNPATYSSLIYRIPLTGPSAGVPVQLLPLPDAVLQLAIDTNGLLLAAMGLRATLTAPILYAIDPATGVVVANGGNWPIRSLNGFEVDRVTGDLLLADDPTGTIYRTASLGGGLYGPPSLLTPTRQSPTGVALRPALSVYGWPTVPTGSATHTWVTSLCPGGGPNVGNQTFGLSIDSAPGIFPGFLCISFCTPTPPPQPITIPGMGITLLLDPATLMLHSILPAQPRATAPLPIPNTLWLAGLDVFAQAAWQEPVGWTATDGLWFTIY